MDFSVHRSYDIEESKTEVVGSLVIDLKPSATTVFRKYYTNKT